MIENEVKSSFQKRIFRNAVTTLWVPVDCVLHILKAYFAYEKCSPDIGDSNDIKKKWNQTRQPDYMQGETDFYRFSKNDTPIYQSGFHPFWHPSPKTPLHGYFACVKKNLRVRIKNPLIRICQKCSRDHFGMSHEVIRQKLTRGNAKNQKNTKTV